MQNMKLLKSLLWTAVGCLSVSACSLPSRQGAGRRRKHHPADVQCNGCRRGRRGQHRHRHGRRRERRHAVKTARAKRTGNPNAIDKYSQGYGYADPAILMKVDQTMSGISVHDEELQMGGMPYGRQLAELQQHPAQPGHGHDSWLPLPRRFARHELRRGHERHAPGQCRGRRRPERRLLDRLSGQHGTRRGLRSRPRVRGRRGDRRRDAGRPARRSCSPPA